MNIYRTACMIDSQSYYFKHNYNNYELISKMILKINSLLHWLLLTTSPVVFLIFFLYLSNRQHGNLSSAAFQFRTIFNRLPFSRLTMCIIHHI